MGKVPAEPLETPEDGCPFLLDFAAPAGTKLHQGEFKLVHEQLGTFSISLIPSGEDAEGFYLCASFN